MPVTTYGALVGRIAAGREDPGRSPHYEILIETPDQYRVAVNVRSVDGSEIFARMDPAFTNPTKLDIPSLARGAMGFSSIPTGPLGRGLDYLRDDLFALDQMVQLPPDGPGATLTPDFDAAVKAAMADDAAVAIALGAFYADTGADTTFGFKPEQGVHDIHMMQGNAGTFESDNRVNGDGALFIRHGDGTVFAFFARFATQATITDPQTGNPAQV